MNRKSITVVLDEKGHSVVIINKILFYGKKNIPWNEVEEYLKQYIGSIALVAETKEKIHIDSIFPDEFKGSEDTKRNAKAKANQGWYRYLTRFAIPVILDEKHILYYNIYLATLIVRVDKNGLLYLYDVINVKKEDTASFEI